MSGCLTVGKLVVTGAENGSLTDAFGRLRVSNPTTLYDFNSVFSKSPFLFEETPSNSTIHILDSYVSMQVGSLTPRIVRQSYEYISYQPGKSRLVFMTGVLNSSPVAGVVSRIGSFDEASDKTVVAGGGNGFFFELDGTTLYVVKRFSTNNVGQTDVRVAQVAWNIDPLDGTGPSGITLNDYSKALIFVIEQEWLGVGDVRMGLVDNNKIIYVHSFKHFAALPKPYNRMAKLPLRYEIKTDGSNSGEMRMMCGTVISEGGYMPLGHIHSVGRGTNWFSLVDNSERPILSLRLKNSFNRVTVRLRSLSVITGSNETYFYRVLRLSSASLLGTSQSGGLVWLDSGIGSATEYNLNAETITVPNDVAIMGSGYLSQQGNQIPDITFLGNDSDLVSQYPLVSHINGESFLYVVTAKIFNIQSNRNIAAEISFVEVFE